MYPFRYIFLLFACLLSLQTALAQNNSTNQEKIRYYAQYSCGLIGTILGNYMRVPQIYEIWKNKSSENVSSQANWLALFALAAWEAYGILGNDYMVIASSAVGIALQIILTGLTYHYRKINPESTPLLSVGISQT